MAVLRGSRRLAGLIAGTALMLAAALGVWAWNGHAGTGNASSPASPSEAAAQVITPGPTARSTPAAGSRQGPPGAAAPAADKSQPAAAKAADGESWQVIYLDDQRIGWSRSAQRRIGTGSAAILRSTTEVQMKFKRYGQPVEMRQVLITDESPEGEFLQYSIELHNPPAASSVTSGLMEGKELRIESTVAGRSQVTRLPWDPEVKSPAYQDRIMKDPPLKPGDKRTFKAFMPDFSRIAQVRIVADDRQMVKLLDGRQHKLLKVRMSNSILPDMTRRAFLDDAGRVLRTEDDVYGKQMITYTVSRDEAMKKLVAGDLDIAVNTLVPCGPIRNAHASERVVYRITMPGDDPSRVFPAGETQSVKAIGTETVEVTVTSLKLPPRFNNVPIGDEFTKPTQFLQSNDPAVIEHARKASPSASNPLTKAVQMEQYVNRRLSRKTFSTALASAAEVAGSLEGDCTEHAMLLAAMLRAGGIPSRVAIGLVYIESGQALGGHMWTEAWIGGRWYPLDATLGKGRVGGGHLKLSDSSLADDAPAPITSFLPLIQVLGKVKVEIVEAK